MFSIELTLKGSKFQRVGASQQKYWLSLLMGVDERRRSNNLSYDGDHNRMDAYCVHRYEQLWKLLVSLKSR